MVSMNLHFAMAQNGQLTGKISDEESGEPLAFVGLVVNEGKFGGYSDIDGKFYLRSSEPIRTITASYVGYETREIQVGQGTRNLVFSMKRTSIELNEVIILPKENPAHRIILNATGNRVINDPFKLSSFSYTAYEKLVFTSDLDSISHIDTLTADSGLIKARKFFDNQYFALIENVVQRSFQYPQKSLQKVIATKISGLKDPIFVFLLSQLQPVSFYDDVISIMDQSLINPISKGSTSRYFFQIRDTITFPDSRDTTYVIFFRPFKGTNFEGLTGLLYINSGTWAIQNVIAHPSRDEGALGIRIQQMYEKVDGIHWFPVQLNTDLTFRNVEITTKGDSTKGYHVVGKGRSYLKDIEINGVTNKRDFSQVEIFVDPDASRREKEFWDQFRVDSLTTKEQKTYDYMDSLGRAENFDRKTRNIETMLTGKLPVGFLDLEMNKLFRYNEYEGSYFGLGLVTNRKISDKFRLGGYWGYGLNDKVQKYGGTFSCFPVPGQELEFRLMYKYDIRESGGVTFFDDNSVILYERFRNFLIQKMDYDETRQASITFRTLKYVKIFTALNLRKCYTGYPYYFSEREGVSNDFHSTFRFTEALVGIRFAYKEKFLKNARTQISMGTNYPLVWFQYGRGLRDVFNGEYAYDHLDVKVTKSFFIKYLGKSSFCMNLGMVIGKVPYTTLYNGNGSYRQFTIYTPNSFSTMRMNEFLSDQYAALYITHNFGKLLVRYENFKPEIAVATNIAFGSLKEKNVHHLVDYKTLDKGYFESGVLFNNLLSLGLSSFGIGGYYRYGSYALPRWQDNVSMKFSLLFPF